VQASDKLGGRQAPPAPPFLKAIIRRKEIGVLISLLLVIIAFSLFSGLFLTSETFGGILTIAAEFGVVALGVTLLMISGEFDLSVGSNFALSAMIFATLFVIKGWPDVVSFAVSLLAALLVGLLNGIVTLKLRMPSFIVTLGTLMVWRGVVLLFTGGFPISYLGESSSVFTVLAGRYGDVHLSAFWWILLAAILGIVLERTRYGNWTFATGGKFEAARELGVSVNRVKLVNFAITGLLAGLGGSLQFARLRSTSPSYGEGLELTVIAAAVVGGTSLTGGSGSILGTVLGTFMLAMINVGLVLGGAPVFWYRTFVGIVILLAVATHIKIRGLARGRT
jgi:simple sugar transport system permease protein